VLRLAGEIRRCDKGSTAGYLLPRPISAAVESATVRLATGFTRIFCVIQCSCSGLCGLPTLPASDAPQVSDSFLWRAPKIRPRLGLLNGVCARGERDDSQKPKWLLHFTVGPAEGITSTATAYVETVGV